MSLAPNSSSSETVPATDPTTPTPIMPSAILDTTAPPFAVKAADRETLARSEGFSILREHLATHYESTFCNDHISHGHTSPSSWLLVRDILHSLLVPVVELYDTSATIAASAMRFTCLGSQDSAYHSNARTAYLWLTCALGPTSTRDWAYTRGCPACVTYACLASPTTVQLLHAACLLSDVQYPFPGPKLPSFLFFLDALQRACAADPAWGAPAFAKTHAPATELRDGVQALIHQCIELNGLLSALTTPAEGSSAGSSGTATPVLNPLDVAGAQLGRRLSKKTKKQAEVDRWRQGVVRRNASETDMGTLGEEGVGGPGVEKMGAAVAVREVWSEG